MNEKEVRDCPKCGGKMEKGARITSVTRARISAREVGGIKYEIPEPLVKGYIKRREKFDGILPTTNFIYDYSQKEKE